MIFPSATEEGLPPHRPYHTDHPVEGYSLHSLPNNILHKGVVRLYTATHPTVLCDQWLWTDIEAIFSRQRQIGREELFAAWNVAHRIIAAGGRRTTFGICVTSSCFPTTNFVLRFHSLTNNHAERDVGPISFFFVSSFPSLAAVPLARSVQRP